MRRKTPAAWPLALLLAAAQVQAAGRGGVVRFAYGDEVVLKTALLQITDIAFEPGETLLSAVIGDSARFALDNVTIGSGSTAVPHLLVKPLDYGFSTTAMVATDRRAYHLTLVATQHEFVPRVEFTYPDQELAVLRLAEEQRRREIAERSIPVDDEGQLGYLENLDFAYELTGDEVYWKPVRVFNDGQKTIIELPEAVLSREAPILVGLDREGGWFSDPEYSVINYRLHGRRMIVDTLFDTAVLMTGQEGAVRDRVIISYVGQSPALTDTNLRTQ